MAAADPENDWVSGCEPFNIVVGIVDVLPPGAMGCNVPAVDCCCAKADKGAEGR